jgi:hypothetical protein
MEYSIQQNKLISKVHHALEQLSELGVESQDPQFKLKQGSCDCSAEEPCDDCVDWVNDSGCYDPCSTLCLNFNCEGCIGFCNIDGGFTQNEALTIWEVGLKVAKTHTHKGKGV